MKEIRKKLINFTQKVMTKSAKNDINSTSSPWSYQSKMPKGYELLKK